MSKAIRVRQAQPAWPTRAIPASTMLVRNRVVTLERIDVGPWEQAQIKHRAADRCTLTAVLSDGTTVERKAIVSYRENEREEYMDAMLRNTMTYQQTREFMSMIHRRAVALQRVRGELQREYALRVQHGTR